MVIIGRTDIDCGWNDLIDRQVMEAAAIIISRGHAALSPTGFAVFLGLFFPCRYNVLVPTAHTCLVSFTDTNNIRHAVEAAASTLYEAATLAMAEFRHCEFTENATGPATLLTVTVKGPSTSHEVQWGRSRRYECVGRLGPRRLRRFSGLVGWTVTVYKEKPCRDQEDSEQDRYEETADQRAG